jgi:cytochrome P450
MKEAGKEEEMLSEDDIVGNFIMMQLAGSETLS